MDDNRKKLIHLLAESTELAANCAVLIDDFTGNDNQEKLAKALSEILKPNESAAKELMKLGIDLTPKQKGDVNG